MIRWSSGEDKRKEIKELLNKIVNDLSQTQNNEVGLKNSLFRVKEETGGILID